MRKIVEIGLYFSVAIFILSGWAIAMGYRLIAAPAAPRPAITTGPPPLLNAMPLRGRLPSDDLLSNGLIGELLKPASPLLWAYLLMAWLAALWFALRLSGARDRPADPSSGEVRRHGPPTTPGLLLIGLLAAALWPWLVQQWPIAGYALATLMFVTIMKAATLRLATAGGAAKSHALGVLAGWATVTFCMALAHMLENNLALTQGQTGLLALLVCALFTLWVQLQLRWPVTYSATVMLGLTGLALSVMNNSIPLAIAAATALIFVALALIRGTT